MRLRGLRLRAALLGALLAAVPLVASAAEGGRSLEPGHDMTTAMLATLGAIAALMLVSTLGYLYRMRRGIWWHFQVPEERVGDDHLAHGGDQAH